MEDMLRRWIAHRGTRTRASRDNISKDISMTWSLVLARPMMPCSVRRVRRAWGQEPLRVTKKAIPMQMIAKSHRLQKSVR